MQEMRPPARPLNESARDGQAERIRVTDDGRCCAGRRSRLSEHRILFEGLRQRRTGREGERSAGRTCSA